MSSRNVAVLSGALFVVGASFAMAQTPGVAPLPGDRGRIFDGVLPAGPPPSGPPPGLILRKAPRAPDVALALAAAQAVAEGCKQYTLSVAVVNSEGAPILVYVTNGSDPNHGYTAVRKAYSAITFKAPTSSMIEKARSDVAVAAKVKADPNLVAFKGGIPLKVGDEIIGAIGVSGAEPGGHDDECVQIGVDKIIGQLK